MTLAVGILLGILLVAGGAVIVAILLGPDPPAEPPHESLEDGKDRAMLFRPTTWRRAQYATTAENRPGGTPAFHRPLEVEPMLEQDILPPPREVRGENREA
jgi:hypothetical protein